MNDKPSRVAVTRQAADLLRELYFEHGRLMLHQPGGCGDAGTPMCYPQDEFSAADADILLGELCVLGTEPVPVWMDRKEFGFWSHAHLTFDAVPGRGTGFSLEAPKGFRFIVRSRLLTDEEARAWDARRESGDSRASVTSMT